MFEPNTGFRHVEDMNMKFKQLLQVVAVFVLLSHQVWASDDVNFAQAMIDSDETICDEIGITRIDLLSLIGAMKREIKRRARVGESVKFERFGTFTLERVPGTTVTDPESRVVPAHDVLKFTPYDVYVERKPVRLSDR
jgi:nucleoid DNA-binding protein